MKTLIFGAALALFAPTLALADDKSGDIDARGGVMTDMMTDEESTGSIEAGTARQYTIVTRTDSNVQTGNDKESAGVNRNTDPAAIRRTIAANPGLSEALERNGVDPDAITALKVQPTGRVLVYLAGR